MYSIVCMTMVFLPVTTVHGAQWSLQRGGGGCTQPVTVPTTLKILVLGFPEVNIYKLKPVQCMHRTLYNVCIVHCTIHIKLPCSLFSKTIYILVRHSDSPDSNPSGRLILHDFVILKWVLSYFKGSRYFSADFHFYKT